MPPERRASYVTFERAENKQSTDVLPARVLIQFSAVFNHDWCRCCPVRGASDCLHLSDHVHPLRDAPEHHMPPIQEVRLDSADKELQDKTEPVRENGEEKKKTSESSRWGHRWDVAGLDDARLPRFRSGDLSNVVWLSTVRRRHGDQATRPSLDRHAGKQVWQLMNGR